MAEKKPAPVKLTAHGQSPVRYGGGADDVLKAVLLSVWSYRCYWCKRHVEFEDAEIDHLIPQKPRTATVEEIAENLGLSGPVDLHAPANLAPCHHHCNNEKRDSDFSQAPRMMLVVQKARAFAPRVIRGVNDLLGERGVKEALVVVQGADIENAQVRSGMKLIAEAATLRLEPNTMVREVDVHTGGGHFRTVLVDTGSKGHQEVLLVLERVLFLDLAELLEGPVREVMGETAKLVHSHFHGKETSALGSPVDAGDPAHAVLSMDVDELSWGRDGSTYSFNFEGTFEAQLTVSLVVSSPNGDELWEEEQGDAFVPGRFVLQAEVSTEDDSEPELEIEVHIAEGEVEVWSTLDRYFSYDDLAEEEEARRLAKKYEDWD
ncbi:HNH endonuclease [Janibacter sp. GXQ6167]|uniref:HNH endonuclease n=1 Tax=Janibacter sp. GXQ6167 TaxID=3240791 RepID=UPI003524F15B